MKTSLLKFSSSKSLDNKLCETMKENPENLAERLSSLDGLNTFICLFYICCIFVLTHLLLL